MAKRTGAAKAYKRARKAAAYVAKRTGVAKVYKKLKKKLKAKMKAFGMKYLVPRFVKLAMKAIPRAWKPLFRACLPKLLAGDIHGVINMLVPKFKILLLQPMLDVMKTPMLRFECEIRRFLLAVLNSDYRTRFSSRPINWSGPNGTKITHEERIKFDRGPVAARQAAELKGVRKGPHCEGNKERHDYGPFRVVVRKVESKTQKVVCEFDFGGDMLSCEHSEKNCCIPQSWNYPRTSSTRYDPKNQVKGHLCKEWYMKISSFIGAFYGAAIGLNYNHQMAECMKEGCTETKLCNQKACNASGKCQWKSGKRSKFQVATTKGYCAQKRL